MVSERVEGPTPAGGAYAVAYFMDKTGAPVDKARAVKCEVVEFDAQDKAIMRTYASLGPRPATHMVHKFRGRDKFRGRR